MAFSVKVDEKNIFPVITLKDENNCEAEIYSFGAILNAFTVSRRTEKINVIDGFASPEDARKNVTNGFKSAKLSPFVCRMQEGKFSFNGNDHTIKKFSLGTSAIHGLLFDAPFSVINTYADDTQARADLQYEYANTGEGYPYSYSCNIIYTLEENNTLTIETNIINTDDKSIPITDGWHPYFQLGGSINEWQAQFNSNTMLEFDTNLLPTGKSVSNPVFETMGLFNETFLDNCFILKDHNKPACILKNNNNGLQLIINADASYPYLQVYTPPHRKSIAIENLSGAPDSFNNGIGLTIVKPGERYRFTTSYKVTTM